MSSEDIHNGVKRLRSRVSLFMVLPFFIGSIGLGMSFAKRKFINESHQMNFDSDFILPFLLTFVLVIVVMVQTQGFKSAAKPILTWPKVIRKKKIVRKTVIVDDDGNVITDEKILKQIEAKMKDVKKDK